MRTANEGGLMRDVITTLVQTIRPFDTTECQHITTTLQWIDSGAPLWRTHKPATPPTHLVSYFVLVDVIQQRLLLVDHKLADLWLPSGGHVETDEHPTDTVRRELQEELFIEAQFVVQNPFFITVTQTVGQTAGHTDVSLWYVLHGDSGQTYTFDAAEFHTIAWFPLDNLPLERSDPHLERFGRKLHKYFTSSNVS